MNKALPRARIEPLRDVIEALSRRDLHVQHYLELVERRLKELEPLIQAFVAEGKDPVEGLSNAIQGRRSHDRVDPLASLNGIPMAIHDTIHVGGLPTRAGSSIPPDVLKGEEGPLIKKARELGALFLGKARCGELGYLAPPPTRNPHDLTRSPGSSTGGCAAAVMAGLCAIGVGLDSMGSTAASASFCGITGFKPTQDRILAQGSVHLSPSLDQVAIFTRDVGDMELTASLFIPGWERSQEQKAGVLAVPQGKYLGRAGTLSMKLFKGALERIELSGLRIEFIDIMDNFHEIAHKQKRLLSGEAARVHSQWLDEFGTLLRPETKSLLERGLSVPERELQVLRRSRTTLKDSLLEVMEEKGISAWICPSATGPAPPFGLRSTGEFVMGLPWVFAGLPVVSIPCGTTQEGLPMGIQLVGRWMEDEVLLDLANRIESEFIPKAISGS